MKTGFYLRLALDGIRKNRRLYLPYLMTCAGMVMMFYILYSLAYSPVVRAMRGGGTTAVILLLGWIVPASAAGKVLSTAAVKPQITLEGFGAFHYNRRCVWRERQISQA